MTFINIYINVIYRYIVFSHLIDCKKIRLGSSIADPMSLFQCHVAMTVSQYEVLFGQKVTRAQNI